MKTYAMQSIRYCYSSVISFFILLFLLQFAYAEDPNAYCVVRYQSDFSVDAHGWTGGFADYPVSIWPEDWDMDFDYEPLPASLNLDANGLMLQGDNHSDDLFMYVKRPYDRLMPNTTYRVLFQLDLASNAATGTVGVGGSSGDSVYVKVGVSLTEPNAVIGDSDHWRMNIDKGNQASSGEDAITIGTIGVELPGLGGGLLYKMKSLDHSQDPLFVTTDDQGRVWLLVGTDSGFEALTRIYLADISVEFTLVTDIHYQSDFSVDAHGWTGSFADYPVSVWPEDWDMDFDYEPLPASLNLDANGLMLQGDNHSDDLFMYVKRLYCGLMPNTTYRVLFQLDLASNAATGTVGVGGSSGDSVYVKVGVSLTEPNAIAGEDDYWYMNIDKGNQASSGEDGITIGTVGVELPGVGGGLIYKMKSLDNIAEPLFISTDNQGHVWLLVGIDSGFEALTRIYLADIAVEFTPVVRYRSNFSVDEDGWTGGFADYPISVLPENWDMAFGYEPLPASLNLDANGLMLQGDNHSDDLFMCVKRPYYRLMPNTTYRVVFQVDLASNSPTGTVGVGGSPGDSVYVKVGVSLTEPNAIAGDDDYWHMNIDKGNQASSGEDSITIGTVGVELPGVGGGLIYKMKSLDNLAEPLFITTDNQGHVWLLVGIDSGFEALTRIYLADISVEFIPVICLYTHITI